MSEPKVIYGYPLEDEVLTHELREAAWNVLHENPGTDFELWKQLLLEQYPAEVIDVLGINEKKVMEQLHDWWEGETYLDPVTGLCATFSEWAEYFINEKTVELYDMLEEALTSNKAL